MSQAPVMPVSTDAFTADTTHLSAEEVGAYWLLLCALWRNNGDPFADDDIRLARICRVTPARWRTRIRPVLVAFFDLSDKVWRQKRLEKEWKKVQEHKAISRDKANARWRRNSLKDNDSDNAAASPQHVPKAWSPNPTPNPVEEKEERESPLTPPKVGAVVDLEWEVWWREVPRKVEKRIAHRAYKSARKKTSAEILLAGVKQWAASRAGEDIRYTKHPARWLNGECWRDEPLPSAQAATEADARRKLMWELDEPYRLAGMAPEEYGGKTSR